MGKTWILDNKRIPPPPPLLRSPINWVACKGWSDGIMPSRYQECGKLPSGLWKECGAERPPNLSGIGALRLLQLGSPPPTAMFHASLSEPHTLSRLCRLRPTRATSWHASCSTGKNALKRAESPNTRTETESICASSTCSGIRSMAWFLPFQTRRNPPGLLELGGVVCSPRKGCRFRLPVISWEA